jgi:roadblock/LC7 domain-containing protein
LVLPRHGELISLAFDPDRRSVSGEPIVVARPVGFDTQLVRGAFSISDTGVLAYRMAIASRRQLVWFDHNGRVLGSVGPPDDHAMAAPELSPDGRRIALFRNVDGNDDVWVIPIDGGIATRFTFAPNLDGFPVWTRDGSGIVYTAFHDAWALVERTMAGEERSLFQTSGLKIADDISPDGHLLLYAVQVPASGVDLWVAPLHSEPDRRARAVVQTPSDEMAGQFAPNGAWIAYQSNASGQMEVYVCRFPGPGAQQQVSSDGGNQPRWSRDGTELYYIAADGTLMSIPIAFDAGFHTFHAAAPRTLFPTHLAAGANIPPAVAARSQYAVAPDGRFLMNVVVDGVAPPIVVSVGDGR